MSELTPRRERIYFENLDSLRFLAFFFVFISHTIEQFKITPSSVMGKFFYVLFTLNGQAGPLGVQIFFVLSGFLITYLIFEEKKNNNQRFNIKKFYLRRILRIWPLFFLAVFFGFFIYPLLLDHYYIEKANFFNHLIFLSNFDLLGNGIPTGIPLSVLWSVAVEEQFYLLWPLVFVIPVKFKQVSYLKIFTLLLFVSIIFQLIHHEDKWLNYFHSVSCMGILVIGGSLAYLYTYNKFFAAFIINMPKRFIVLIYFLGFSLIYFVFFIPSSLFFTIYQSLISIFFGFVILEQNFAKNSFYKLGKISIFNYLGKLTYGLYILHPIGIALSTYVINKLAFLDEFHILKFSLALIISIALSFLSYHYFESVFLRLKHKFANPYKIVRI